MTDVYCGIGKIPKGYRRGTMKQCAQKGQVRYYGVKKIDPKILEHAKKSKAPSKSDLTRKFSKNKGRLKHLDRLIKSKYSDASDKRMYRAEKKQLKKENRKLAKQIKAMKGGKRRSKSRSKSKRRRSRKRSCPKRKSCPRRSKGKRRSRRRSKSKGKRRSKSKGKRRSKRRSRKK